MTNIKTRPWWLLIMVIFCVGLMQAQESINASGGDGLGVGGSVAYSVGQVVYTTNMDLSGVESQGVQQVYQITMVDNKEVNSGIALSIFPNPMTDHLTLQIKDYQGEKIFYRLIDARGNLMMKGQLDAGQTQISTGSLPSSMYFMHLVDQGSQRIQTYKIIKK